jgi:hypothetical protein
VLWNSRCRKQTAEIYSLGFQLSGEQRLRSGLGVKFSEKTLSWRTPEVCVEARDVTLLRPKDLLQVNVGSA